MDDRDKLCLYVRVDDQEALLRGTTEVDLAMSPRRNRSRCARCGAVRGYGHPVRKEVEDA